MILFRNVSSPVLFLASSIHSVKVGVISILVSWMHSAFSILNSLTLPLLNATAKTLPSGRHATDRALSSASEAEIAHTRFQDSLCNHTSPSTVTSASKSIFGDHFWQRISAEHGLSSSCRNDPHDPAILEIRSSNCKPLTAMSPALLEQDQPEITRNYFRWLIILWLVMKSREAFRKSLRRLAEPTSWTAGLQSVIKAFLGTSVVTEDKCKMSVL